MLFCTFSFMFLFFPCVLSVMSVARHMLTAQNEVDCNYILRESLDSTEVLCRQDAGIGGACCCCTCAVRHPSALTLPLALWEQGAEGLETQPVWCTSGGINVRPSMHLLCSNKVFPCIGNFSVSAPKCCLLNTLALCSLCSVRVQVSSKHKGTWTWAAGPGVSLQCFRLLTSFICQSSKEAHAVAT